MKTLLRILFFATWIVSFENRPVLAAIPSSASLRVVTYNVWQLPLVAKDLKTRAQLLPMALKNLEPDLIAIQELWLGNVKSKIVRQFAKLGYPYSFWSGSDDISFTSLASVENDTDEVDIQAHDFLKGILGNGLLIVSRFPLNLAASKELKFSGFTAIDEWLASKGALHVLVNLGHDTWMDFYNTHLGAIRYDAARETFSQFDLDRQAKQLSELSQFIRTSRETNLQLVAGDFNLDARDWDNGAKIFRTDRENPTLQKFKSDAELQDPFSDLSLVAHLLTYSRNNPYVHQAKKSIYPAWSLDHFYLGNKSDSASRWSASSLEVVLRNDGPVPTLPLSDHYGLRGDFSWETQNP